MFLNSLSNSATTTPTSKTSKAFKMRIIIFQSMIFLATTTPTSDFRNNAADLFLFNYFYPATSTPTSSLQFFETSTSQ